MRLSPHEAAWCAIQAGFSPIRTDPAQPSEVEMVVAIGYAESKLETDALGRTLATTTTDPASEGNHDHGWLQLSGRWQWDKIIKAGGAWRDPVTNARIGRQIYLAQGWAAWHVYTSGAYKTYLPDARIGAAHPWPCPSPDAIALEQLRTGLDQLGRSLSGTSTTNQAKLIEMITSVQATVDRIKSHFV